MYAGLFRSEKQIANRDSLKDLSRDKRWTKGCIIIQGVRDYNALLIIIRVNFVAFSPLLHCVINRLSGQLDEVTMKLETNPDESKTDSICQYVTMF